MGRKPDRVTKGRAVAKKRRINQKPRYSVSDERKVVVKSLVDADMPYSQIRDITGLSNGYISRIVKEFEESKPLVEHYKKNKIEILMKSQAQNLSLQDAIRNRVTEEYIDSWTPTEKQRWFSGLGVDFGIKYDKERLESGQSTENVGVVVKAMHEWKRLKEQNG